MKRRNHTGQSLPNDVIRPERKFEITEAYKLIRTNIMFSLLKDGCKTIVISSSQSREGKTTTAINVAVSLAQTDAKVLLIDADLRKPRVGQFFNYKEAPGLTNYLGKLVSLPEVLHQTEFSNLSVLCSGVNVPNPSELLASEKMASFLTEMESGYDYIVIDTPPLNVVVDALPLIKLSDGVILVVRERYSTFPQLNQSIRNVELIGGKILGIVLNDSKSRGKGLDQYEKYGYGTAYYDTCAAQPTVH